MCMTDINDSLHSFCNVLGEVTSPLFKKNSFNNNMHNDRSNNENKVPYFDNECKQLKKSYYVCLNCYRNNAHNYTRIAMVHAISEYKRTLRKRKFIYDRNETKRLETARLSNAKEHWKMLKGSTNINSKCSISSSDFF